MKKYVVISLFVFLMVGCAGEYKVYDGGNFSFEYPAGWEVSVNEATGLASIDDSSGTPTLGFSNLSDNFGMEGWTMQKKEDFTGKGGVEFSLIFNKVDSGFIEEGDWAEGQEMLDVDTTMVMISTPALESPMFYTFDNTDSDGEIVMKAILDSFVAK